MMARLRTVVVSMLSAMLLASLTNSVASGSFVPPSKLTAGTSQEDAEKVRTTLRLADEIRHQILMLPYYGVFDWITGSVKDDGTVTIVGYVVRPATKSDLEARVKKLPGVTNLVDNIEVLPPSPSDERIRIAVYRTLFRGGSPLFKYATMAVPSIHIIVKNGHLILEGIVDNKFDYNYANVKAKGVPGVFSVDNQLQTPGNR
ncbi:MAG TPA: BON domain-containing protein [Blastocatellia bacterium]|nr:BON domain-containing protein [Blastocatellia bacterium]